MKEEHYNFIKKLIDDTKSGKTQWKYDSFSKNPYFILPNTTLSISIYPYVSFLESSTDKMQLVLTERLEDCNLKYGSIINYSPILSIDESLPKSIVLDDIHDLKINTDENDISILNLYILAKKSANEYNEKFKKSMIERYMNF